MKIVSGVVKGALRLRVPELSKEALTRLGWLDWYYSHGNNARLTCRHFGISPQTFYRWFRRFDPEHLESLEEHSRRPRHTRQPTSPADLVEAVRALREERPR